jgi:hypothetical protein
MITSVQGDSEIKTIRDFVDNYLLARDSRAFREYVSKISPDVDLKVSFTKANGDVVEGVDLPIGASFFWPDLGV